MDVDAGAALSAASCVEVMGAAGPGKHCSPRHRRLFLLLLLLVIIILLFLLLPILLRLRMLLN
jgi:hypothetical protein